MVDEPVLTRDHPSSFRDQRYVYPVLSRRAKGLSIGINLSPTKLCTFRCLYCQRADGLEFLNEKNRLDVPRIDMDLLESELSQTSALITSGRIFEDQKFRWTPESKRILRDFAFSGDGEPTLSPAFPEALNRVIRVKTKQELKDSKIVLITNGTRFDQEELAPVFDRLLEHQGEIWAKLDAGTEEYYRQINRSHVPYSQIRNNLRLAAGRWPLVIQTMRIRTGGELPNRDEWNAYLSFLQELLESGGKIQRIQLYTLARPPAEESVSALQDEEMDRLAEELRRTTSVEVDVFYTK